MAGLNYSDLEDGGKRIEILPQLTIAANYTTTTGLAVSRGGSAGQSGGVRGAKYLAFHTVFDYGSGGTECDLYLQTSLDGGSTWFDIANHHYTTADATKVSAISTGIAPASQAFAPGSGALTDNTIIQGVLGDRFRVMLVTTGDYVDSTITADITLKG